MPFELAGCLRRIRRTADLSQRELAQRAGISKTAVAAAEAGTRDLPVAALARAAELAGLRVALLDADGHEAGPMRPDGAVDAALRRLPAHLDTEHTDEVAHRWEHRPHRRQPWFTFALDRAARDARRAELGVPDDHDVPVAGDSPEDRRVARRRAARLARDAERERRFLAGELAGLCDGWTCTCPPLCAQLDDHDGPPVHAPDCPCRCDVG